MRKVKFFAGLFTVLSLVLATCVGAEVKAATPNTWTIRYNTDRSEWMAKGEADTEYKSLYTFSQQFNDGDKIVLDGTDANIDLTLQVGKRIGELAFNSAKACTVYATGVDYVYALPGAVGIVNADVVKASVASNSTLQINGNVNEFYAKNADGKGVNANVGVTGIVEYAEVAVYSVGEKATSAYQFEAGSFSLKKDNIYLETPADKYSLTGSAPATSTSAADTSAAAETTATTQTTKVLDSVPKTGVFDLAPALYTLGAAFMTGGVICLRKNKE